MGVRAALVVAVAVLVWAGSASEPVRAAPAAPTSTDGNATALLTDQAPVPSGRHALPLPGSTPIWITLSLRFSHAGRLTDLLGQLDDPASPEFRAFLPPAEFREQFAPTAGAVLTAESALLAAGARSVSVTPDRLGVAAVVPASGVASLFGVRLVSFPGPGGREVYTALGTPRLPASVAGIVAGVGGLSNAGNAAVELATREGAPRPVGQFVVQNSTGAQWDVGSDFAPAYGASELWPGPEGVPNATYPGGIAVATLLASGYNSTSLLDLPPFDPSVVDAYFNATLGPGWPTPSITGVPVNAGGAGLPPLPGSFHGRNDSTEDEYENSLDLEMAGSLAPGASLYTFYFAGSQMLTPLPAGDIADDFADDLAGALAYNYSPAHLAVVSASFGLPDLNDSLWDSELEEASATGVTVVCATGDQGNAPDSLTGRVGGQWPTWPASAAFEDFGAVSVGGVSLTLAGTPTSNATYSSVDAAYDPNVTGISAASAWYGLTDAGLYAGSEGGASLVYPEPGWQTDSAAQWPIVNATILEGAGSLGRAEPDVALPANNTIAYVFANATGAVYLELLGGTSIGAPVLAGLLSDVVAVESARAGRFAPLGYLDPELYRIASYFASPAIRNSTAEAADPFLDVVHGSNYVFSAAAGWDAVTGWGGLNASAFLAADLNGTIRGYQYTGPTPGLPSRGASSPLSAQTEYLLIGIGALVAIALAVVAARPARRPSLPPGASAGGAMPGGLPLGGRAPPPGPTFVCPYCGGVRPAEPVRCPHCGML